MQTKILIAFVISGNRKDSIFAWRIVRSIPCLKFDTPQDRSGAGSIRTSIPSILSLAETDFVATIA